MSTLNGSTYRKSVTTRSVYSDSFPLERRNGFPTPPHSTMTYLEPPLRAPSRARTPTEVAAVDPTLEDAQKAGNNYHITMSLNAALADAGLPASVATATGRLSQIDYATNSRAQTEYGTNSQRGSRIGFVPQMAPAWTTERPGSVSVVRVTGNDVVANAQASFPVVAHAQATFPVVAHAQATFPVTQPRDDHGVIVNEAYTIKSVQPSSVTRKEMVTTVERPKSRVGFDLELVGGQTTVVTETTSSAASDQRKQHGGSVGALSKSARPTSSSNGDHQSTWKTSSEWTEVSEEANPKRGGKKTTKSENRQLWNPGDSTRHLPHDHDLPENRRQRATGVGLGVKSHRRTGGIGPGVKGLRSYDNGAMLETADIVDGMETLEYETVNPWLIYGMEGGPEEDESMAIYRNLAYGADPSSVRQEVTYGERETEIVRQKNGRIQQDLVNVDIVSENVTVVVGNGLAQMTIKVRTERIVPIDDVKELFQKSSVTVTRLIEVDMMATPERQRIYNQVLQSQRGQGRTLSQKQTFDLYKAFLRLTEDDPGNSAHEEVRIDKETEEARLADLTAETGLNFETDPISTSSRSSSGYRPRIL